MKSSLAQKSARASAEFEMGLLKVAHFRAWVPAHDEGTGVAITHLEQQHLRTHRGSGISEEWLTGTLKMGLSGPGEYLCLARSFRQPDGNFSITPAYAGGAAWGL
ncbi:MAG: hypothetical protein HKL85_12520 [Acidimicrobiaceae bacterium]|nr:hypothetical protein [Acidimicrobiaceae bacterium]